MLELCERLRELQTTDYFQPNPFSELSQNHYKMQPRTLSLNTF